MVEFTHVLCPTDLSESSRPPLAYGAALAGWYGARLSILHVVPTFDAIQVPPGAIGESVQVVYPTTRDEVIEALRAEARRLDGVESMPDLVAEAGDPVEVIVDRAISTPADLIVLGTHGRSGVRRLLHGSVAEQVRHRAPCPVLTVPPHAPDAPGKVIFKRILCAMDFSPASLQALGFAMDLGRQANGVVTVLHSLEWLADVEPRAHTHFSVAEYRGYLQADARERLENLLQGESRTWCEVEHVVTVGRAYREILKAAEERQAELIVMGTSGHGGLAVALLGSTTHQVMRAASCPVLTVRGVEAPGGA